MWIDKGIFSVKSFLRCSYQTYTPHSILISFCTVNTKIEKNNNNKFSYVILFEIFIAQRRAHTESQTVENIIFWFFCCCCCCECFEKSTCLATHVSGTRNIYVCFVIVVSCVFIIPFSQPVCLFSHTLCDLSYWRKKCLWIEWVYSSSSYFFF